MYAIIQSGAKQYRVEKGDVIKVEKLDAEIGDEIKMDVLMTASGKTVKVGKPTVKNVAATAKVLAHGKEKKIVVFHYKAKKDYRKKQGHRQPYTTLEIIDISAPASAKAEKAEAEKKVEEA